MDSLGWSDPVLQGIILVYRRKGERREDEFSGPIFILGEDKSQMTHVPREELPRGSEQLDLTNVPVVSIGGKRKHQKGKIQRFLSENLGFSGAFLCYPGSGNWDLGEGFLIVTSKEVLEGKKVSGGRPEEQLINYRWERDGRYVCDRAMVLHGKPIKMLEEGIELEPGAEKIANALASDCSGLPHPLRDVCTAVSYETFCLKSLEALLRKGEVFSQRSFVEAALLEKLKAAGVRFVKDIPAELTVTVEEIVPELVAQRETLGMVEIPGIGRKLPEKHHLSGIGYSLIITLTPEEVRNVTSWPFTDIYIWMAEFGDSFYSRISWGGKAYEALKVEDTVERWKRLQHWLAEVWIDSHKQYMPKNQALPHPKEAALSPLPESVLWCRGLFTGEEYIEYPYVSCDTYDRWTIQWTSDPKNAADWGKDPTVKAEGIRTALELQRKLDEGEFKPQDVLLNWGGHFRMMGSSDNSQYWVIRSDGTLREANDIDYRKRYSSEGAKFWNIVAPDELAIHWSKGSRAGDHCFEVAKNPVAGCTEAQLETVARLEQEIEETWKDCAGLASGKLSPSIGRGWKLPKSKAALKPPVKPVGSSCQQSDPVTVVPVASGPVDISSLKERWGKNRK